MTLTMLSAIWALTLLLGSGIWVALSGWPRRAADGWCALGGGWMVGAAACAVLVRVLSAQALADTVVRVGSCAVGLGLLLWGVAWYRRGAPASIESRAFSSRQDRLWMTLLLALLAWHGGLLASDIVLHPILPWDAWAVWLSKAKAWVLAGRIEPSVSFATWIADADAPVRTGVAWMYPELVPWMAVWFAGGSHWVEPLIALAWFGLWVAMLALHYGYWRALGVRPLAACAGMYALGSLPLLDAHAALGGYADLWVAGVLSLGIHAWLRWFCLGERRQLGIVLLAIGILPLLKLEGAAWSIMLGAACLFSLLPSQLRGRRFLIGALAMLAMVVVCVGLGLQWIGVARRYLDTGRFFDIGQIGASARSLAAALWAQWNWNLLWFILPVALWLRRSHWLHSPLTRRLLGLVSLPFAVMLGLFLFTSAARYAQSYSAVNRLLLQIAPLLVSALVLVLCPPDADTALARDSQRAASASR